MPLRAIGFWSGPWSSGKWPRVEPWVDHTWDADERDFIVSFLRHGVLARTYMGWSTCRVCGKTDNGDSELSDGTYVWPDGLSHYVEEHGVRLPGEFVRHALQVTEHLEGDRDETWWQNMSPDWSPS